MTFQRNICDITLNASSKLTDIYLISKDRRYFIAHKMVLASVSKILGSLLEIPCDFCGDSVDEYSTLFFQGYSGDVLKSFLSLIYTGVSEPLRKEQTTDLKSLCIELKLNGLSSLCHDLSKNDNCNAKTCAFEEVPHYQVLPKFILSRRREKAPNFNVDDDNQYTRIVDGELEENNDLLVDDARLILKCPNCPREFYFRKRYEKHIQECFAIPSEEKSILQRDKTDSDSHADENFGISYELKEQLGDCYNDERGESQKLKPSSSCEVCKKSFKSKFRLQKHLKIHESKTPFRCDKCLELFSTQKILTDHIKLCQKVKSQPSSSFFICKDCGEQFKQRALLRKHTMVHAMRDEVHCEVVDDVADQTIDQVTMLPTPRLNYKSSEENGRIICMHEDCKDKNSSFRWKNGFQEHWLEKHASDEDKIYSCEYCVRKFGSNALRNRHIKFSHVLRFKCRLCEKKFATRQLFLAHKRTHTGEKPFVCEDCGSSFSQKSYLRQHKEFLHSDVKRHKCSKCGDKFKLKSNLKKHLSHHQLSDQLTNYQIPKEIENESQKSSLKIPKVEMPMKEEDGRFFCLSGDCVEKGQSFQWINGLREHFMDKHAAEELKHFPCSYCGKMFGTNGLKNRHAAMFHELRFECTQCDKKYGKKTMLLDHMRTHTGERPFVCESCGSNFFSKQSLSWHIRQRHDDQVKKSYKCDQCHKEFSLLCVLNRHLKTVHSETRPFVCEECGKDYKVLAALKRHMEFHSGETITCVPCDIVFSYQSNYKRHCKRKHMETNIKQ